MFNRMGSSNIFINKEYAYKKEPPNEKEIMNKQISEMKKQLSFL